MKDLKDFKPPARKIDRYRLPGWNDLVESMYTRPVRRPGPPPDREARIEFLRDFLALYEERGQVPTQADFAAARGCHPRTIRKQLKRWGLSWPPVTGPL